MMGGLFSGASEAAVWVSVVLAGVAATYGALRWVGRRVRRAWAKVEAAADTLVGRDAITHPDTGQELAPATPSLGARLAGIETTLHEVADTRAELRSLATQVDGLTKRLDAHLADDCGQTPAVVAIGMHGENLVG